MTRQNLKQRGHTWFARYHVPTELQPAYGRVEVIRTLKTRDFREAQRLLPHVLAAIDAEVRATVSGRGVPMAPAGDPRRYAQLHEAYRALYRSGDRSAPQALADALDAAIEEEPDYLADTSDMGPEELAQRAMEPPTLRAARAFTRDPDARSLREWLNEYADFKRRDGKKLSTVGKMERFIGLMVDHFGNQLDPRHIHRRDADRYVREVIDRRPLKFKTRHDECSYLSSFFSWLRDAGAVESNPFADQTRRLTRAGGGPIDGAAEEEGRLPFSAEELQRLLSLPIPHPRFAAVALVGLYSGLRLEELAQLRTEETTGGVLRIREGKTAAARRSVPVHPIIAPLVDRLRDTSRSGFLFDGLEPSGVDGKRSAALSKALGRWFKSALPGTRAVFHSLRHNLATSLERSGTPESTIALILGHKRTGVTMGTYAHGLELEQLREALNRVSHGSAVDALASELAKASPGNRGSAKRADFGPLRSAVEGRNAA